MEFQYIILIVAGSVFVFLMLIYTVVAIERCKRDKRNAGKLAASYAENNLRRMEYDVALYDGSDSASESVSQVAMDDLFSENNVNDETRYSGAAILGSVEYEGVEEIKGEYDPETAS